MANWSFVLLAAWVASVVDSSSLADRTPSTSSDRFDIDSNAVEGTTRPQTITRKNALFAGSDGGGRTWATVATLLQTAKMNGLDPFAWLTQTLERIAAGWPNRELDQFLPFSHHTP